MKWMHATCGYLVKSTWFKIIKAGIFTGSSIINERTITKDYPETTETPTGHLNQTQKNVRSTKDKATGKGTRTTTTIVDAIRHAKAQKRGARGTSVSADDFEMANTAQLKGKKVRDMYTKVYDVRETVFSDQTGQFPTRSQRGNKYLMVMVEIDSNAIIVEPLKNRKDPELTRAHKTMMLQLKRVGIVPKKHILDNEVSEAMKEVI